MRSGLRWLPLSILVIALDQFSKWFAKKLLIENHPVVVNRFFNWYLTHNHGAAFSFLSNASGWQRWLLAGFSAIVSLIVFVWLKNSEDESYCTFSGLSLILGGALGNLIDRVYPGVVTDFIQWHIGNHYWPTFNIADSAVCVGAVLFIWGMKND